MRGVYRHNDITRVKGAACASKRCDLASGVLMSSGAQMRDHFVVHCIGIAHGRAR